MANELCIPPDIKPETGETVTLVDDQTFKFKPQFGRAWSQRNSFGDPRWQFRRVYRGMRASDRSRMHAALGEAQGGFRTIMVSPAQDPRGTWAAQAGGELYNNADLSSVTGWTVDSHLAAITSNNGVVRLAVALQDGTPGYFYQVPSYSLYSPVAVRAVVRPGRGAFTGVSLLVDNSTIAAFPSQTGLGYLVDSAVAQSTGAISGVYFSTFVGAVTGDYVDVNFMSCARCMLADSGPNGLLQSETFGTTWTASSGATGATIISNNDVAPDGQLTGDVIHENSATSSHYTFQGVTVPAAAADFSVTCAIRAKGRTWAYIQLQESAGNQLATGWINLSTGAVGSATASGANWTGVRTVSTALGSAWYGLSITAKKTSAATTISVIIGAATADLNTSYLGTNIDSIALWRGTFAQSGVPTRLVSTTTVATVGTSQTGPVINVKGLPASQSGLLVAGDWVEVDGQLKMVTASLDSNAAGLGTLQVRPKVARAIADNAPIIVTKPMGRFVLGDSAEWQAQAGLYSAYDLTLEEVYE